MVERGSQVLQGMVLDRLLRVKDPVGTLGKNCDRISFPNLSYEETRILKKEGEDTILIFGCLPTLRGALNHYQDLGMERRELFEVGVLELVEAVSSWDPDKRMKDDKPCYLRVYVGKRINSKLQICIAEAYGLGRSRQDFPLVCLFRQCWLEFIENNGRPPSFNEIAFKVLEENKSRLLLSEPDTGRLYKKTALMYDSWLAKDQIPLDKAGRQALDKPPEEILENEFLAEELKRALETLSPRQAEIIRWRFGLIDGRRMTYEKIAEAYGITYERIRQLEEKALARLKHPYRSRRFRDFLVSG